MKYIQYSELSQHYYVSPYTVTIDITDDINEIIQKKLATGCLKCGSPDIVSEHLRICSACHKIEVGEHALTESIEMPVENKKVEKYCDAAGHYGKDPTNNICPKCNNTYNYWQPEQVLDRIRRKVSKAEWDFIKEKIN